jgi:hypothetical protein
MMSQHPATRYVTATSFVTYASEGELGMAVVVAGSAISAELTSWDVDASVAAKVSALPVSVADIATAAWLAD